MQTTLRALHTESSLDSGKESTAGRAAAYELGFVMVSVSVTRLGSGWGPGYLL